jgi:hypothetical protein
MISRQWRGLAKASSAEAYIDHLRLETFPAIGNLAGFMGATILRRTVPEGVESSSLPRGHHSKPFTRLLASMLRALSSQRRLTT